MAAFLQELAVTQAPSMMWLFHSPHGAPCSQCCYELSLWKVRSREVGGTDLVWSTFIMDWDMFIAIYKASGTGIHVCSLEKNQKVCREAQRLCCRRIPETDLRRPGCLSKSILTLGLKPESSHSLLGMPSKTPGVPYPILYSPKSPRMAASPPGCISTFWRQSQVCDSLLSVCPHEGHVINIRLKV